MVENLNYDANGKCYENDPVNCQKYGKLYDWKTALNICPKGWHLPSNNEWQTLVDFAGGHYKVAGNILKTSSGWENNGNGMDAFGFSALPGGYGDSDDSFINAGNFGFWWSASEYYSGIAYYRGMDYGSENAYWGRDDKSLLFSVRCLQN